MNCIAKEQINTQIRGVAMERTERVSGVGPSQQKASLVLAKEGSQSLAAFKYI